MKIYLSYKLCEPNNGYYTVLLDSKTKQLQYNPISQTLKGNDKLCEIQCGTGLR